MDIKSIGQLAKAALWLPFEFMKEFIQEHQADERRALAISTFTKLSIDEVKAFAKSHPISLEDTMEYAARFGKLPDDETAEWIYLYGFSTWKRFLMKKMVDM